MKKKIKLIAPIVIVIVIAVIAVVYATRNDSEPVNNDVSTLSSAGEETISDTFSMKKYVDVDDDKSKNECNDTTIFSLTSFDIYTKQGIIRMSRDEIPVPLLCDWNTGKAITLGSDMDNKSSLPPDITSAFAYKDKLYIICNKTCFETNNYHKECSIIKADMDLTNQKTILKLNSMEFLEPIELKDNKLFYTVKTLADKNVKFDLAGYNSSSTKTTMTLKSFDLETLTSKDIYTFEEGYSQFTNQIDISDNRISIFYLFANEPYSQESKSEVRVVNIDTKECIDKISSNDKSIYDLKNSIIYFVPTLNKKEFSEMYNKLKSYNTITKKEETLIESDLIGCRLDYSDESSYIENSEKMSLIVVLKNEIVINDLAHKRIYIYDLKGTLKYEVNGIDYQIVDEYENKYILNTGNRLADPSAFISKNDLVNGNFNPVIMQFPNESH